MKEKVAGEIRERAFIIDTSDSPNRKQLSQRLINKIQPWVDDLSREGLKCDVVRVEVIYGGDMSLKPTRSKYRVGIHVSSPNGKTNTK